MEGNLPWALVFMGVGIGAVVELLGVQILPFAVGLYLPIHLSTPIMIGGIIRGILDSKKNNKKLDEKVAQEKIDSGILYSSGLIAGEGVIGIILAILAVIPAGTSATGEALTVADKVAFGNEALGKVGAIIFFALLAISLLKNSLWKKTEEN